MTKMILAATLIISGALALIINIIFFQSMHPIPRLISYLVISIGILLIPDDSNSKPID